MKLRTGLLMITLFLTCVTWAGAQNLLVNPGFEADGALGYWVGTTGWTMADGSFAMLGTDSTNPHSGSYCWAIGAYGTTGLAYTVPMLSQVFRTSSAKFLVSGWVRTNSVGTAMVRVRENKTGSTVAVWKNGAWKNTAWGIAATGGQTSWDCYAMSYFGQGLDQQVVMYNVPQWTKFSFVVTALPGVTEYSLDLGAANRGAVDGGVAYFDDMSVTNATELLTNGDFETGYVGVEQSGYGWTNAPGGQLSWGYWGDNPHGGLNCWKVDNRTDAGPAYTVPMISQAFSTTESEFTVSGWLRTNEYGTALLRIRENKTGSSVLCFKDGKWSNTLWPISAGATSTDAWDCYAMSYGGSGYNQNIVMSNVPDWTPFIFTVPTIPGVTDYSLDFSVSSSGGRGYAYFDDLSVTSPANGLLPPVTDPTGLRNPFAIQPGTATVDGDLSDWADAQWTPMNTVYDGNPTDIQQAYYAAKWSQGKVYVAVKILDTSHYFTNGYASWDGQDDIEVYLHTNSSGSIMYPYEEEAQQYVVGFNPSGTGMWSCFGTTATTPPMPAIPADAGFQCAGSIHGDWLYYELALTPFQYYGGLVGQASVQNVLSATGVIGLDVVAVSNKGGGSANYTGMVAENAMTHKFQNYNQIGRHVLDNGSIKLGNIAQIKSAQDNSKFEVDNAIVTGAYYDVSGSQYVGVCFGIENDTRENGVRVLWNWSDSDATRKVTVGDRVNLLGSVSTVSGERVFKPTNLAVTGNSSQIPAPVGLSNHAAGGTAALGALINDASSDAPAIGLNNTGLLVTIWGKVTKSYVDPSRAAYYDAYYFYVDDGSGLVDGSVNGDSTGNTGIMCRAAGDGYGPYDPAYTPGLYAIPDEGRYVSVTGIVGTQIINGKQVRYFWTKSWNYLD